MTHKHEARSFFLSGPAGPLEAVLWKPVREAPPQLAALVCHPHPLFGGTLHNKVVYQAAKTLDALGVPVLRFNFRGAGRSAGAHDRGAGEREDARTALDFLAGEFPGAPLLAAGFSFGCWVGLRAGCEDARVSELIGIGAPVNQADFTFLSECGKPKLFVHGSEDAFGALPKIEQLIRPLPGENQLVVVPGADHFFAGKLDQMSAAITRWMTLRHPNL